MYKVMLVDDDYPVLDLISYAIDWEGLGLQLIGLHENGLSALEAAERDMPDIVITDIGMPKMDGLELLRRLKERKPDLQAAILSCHSEFHYAQQAVKLQVGEYLLKDTLDPSDIRRLLLQFIAVLDEQGSLQSKHQQMELLVDRNKALMKEKFIRAAISQPMLDAGKWRSELGSFGLSFQKGEIIIPVIGLLDDFLYAKRRFMTEDVLRFALDNVIEETIRAEGYASAHFTFSPQESILLQVFPAGLQVNGYEESRRMMGRIGQAIKQTLKLSMSFLIGDGSGSPELLKASIAAMRANTMERFYRSPGSVVRSRTSLSKAGDSFAALNEAGEKLRELLLGKDEAAVKETAASCLAEAERQKLAPETLKDWMLKLLLDAKVKQHYAVMQRPAQSEDAFYSEVMELGSFPELKAWFMERCLSAVTASKQTGLQSRRSEVAEACDFVSLHLDRKISLEEVAERLFLNPSYFSRLFKKETGETFIEYVTRMKMHRAKELLDRTGEPVGKICETLGYDNQSYFIKLFKSFAGVTPVEYRSRQPRG